MIIKGKQTQEVQLNVPMGELLCRIKVEFLECVGLSEYAYLEAGWWKHPAGIGKTPRIRKLSKLGTIRLATPDEINVWEGIQALKKIMSLDYPPML